MSSAVAEIQKDLHREHQSRGGDGVIGADFDEAEVRVSGVGCWVLCLVPLCLVSWCHVFFVLWCRVLECYVLGVGC